MCRSRCCFCWRHGYCLHSSYPWWIWRLLAIGTTTTIFFPFAASQRGSHRLRMANSPSLSASTTSPIEVVVAIWSLLSLLASCCRPCSEWSRSCCPGSGRWRRCTACRPVPLPRVLLGPPHSFWLLSSCWRILRLSVYHSQTGPHAHVTYIIEK